MHSVSYIKQIEANGNRDVVYLWQQTWVQLGPHVKKNKKKTKKTVFSNLKKLTNYLLILSIKINTMWCPIKVNSSTIELTVC